MTKTYQTRIDIVPGTDKFVTVTFESANEAMAWDYARELAWRKYGVCARVVYVIAPKEVEL